MEDLKKMLTKPCPDCGMDMYYYQCHGKAEGEKMMGMECPVHAGTMLKDCCMKSPETH